MSKTARKNNKVVFSTGDFDNLHHIAKKAKTNNKNKQTRNFENALKSKDLKRILSYEDSI